ncbi:GntR family transcriptional regulator [Pseudochelatococcus sp. B33]
MSAQEDQVSTAGNMIQVLENDILSGLLRPGDRLDEQALAKRFQVSRTPVREALRHMASSGFVELRRNQGAVVKTLTTSEVVEMFQVLGELDGLAARLCARRMTKAEIAAVREQNAECLAHAQAGEESGFLAANTAFHGLIQKGSQNSYLMDEATRLARRLEAYRRYITHPRRMLPSCDEHAAIADAIERGDEDLAHSLMREHVNLIAGSAADVVVALEQGNRG